MLVIITKVITKRVVKEYIYLISQLGKQKFLKPKEGRKGAKAIWNRRDTQKTIYYFITYDRISTYQVKHEIANIYNNSNFII